MISCTITGNLGKDAEMKVLDSGDTVVSFSVASRRYDSKTKEQVADWVNVSYWGKRAEAVSEFLVKGKTVAVRGNVWGREYTHNNKLGFSLECRAEDVELLGGAASDDDGAAPRTEKPARHAPAKAHSRRA